MRVCQANVTFSERDKMLMCEHRCGCLSPSRFEMLDSRMKTIVFEALTKRDFQIPKKRVTLMWRSKRFTFGASI